MFTLSRANLALTLTKLVLKPRICSICTWVGLEVFFNVYGVSLVSSNLKMAGVRRIYRPPSLGAVALTHS